MNVEERTGFTHDEDDDEEQYKSYEDTIPLIRSCLVKSLDICHVYY